MKAKNVTKITWKALSQPPPSRSPPTGQASSSAAQPSWQVEGMKASRWYEGKQKV